MSSIDPTMNASNLIYRFRFVFWSTMQMMVVACLTLFEMKIQPMILSHFAWQVPANELQSDNTPKKFKDVGSNPLQSEEEKQVEWSSEFKRLQKQIIGLWDACHVSLVHRTYFFLLFKGDPSDSIYMEVELRRLFYLKQTFAKGNQTVEDGYILNADTR